MIQNTAFATEIESRPAESTTRCHQFDTPYKNKTFKVQPELLQCFVVSRGLTMKIFYATQSHM